MEIFRDDGVMEIFRKAILSDGVMELFRKAILSDGVMEIFRKAILSDRVMEIFRKGILSHRVMGDASSVLNGKVFKLHTPKACAHHTPIFSYIIIHNRMHYTRKKVSKNISYTMRVPGFFSCGLWIIGPV